MAGENFIKVTKLMVQGASATLVITALISVQVLFGVNYVISKVIVDAFPPLAWANFRIVCSALILLMINLALNRPHPKANRDFFIPLILFSLLGVIINQACFLVGIHYTTSTNSAILNTLIPIFTLIIVSLRGQEPVTFNRVLGFIFAFVGVLVIRKVEEFSLSDKTLIGDLLTIVNCLSYACFLSISKDFIARNDRMWTTTWLFIYGSVGFTALAAHDWAHLKMPTMTSVLWGCVVFNIVGGTLLTYFLNNWALAYAKSSHVAVFIYIQPIVTSIIAWLWLGEQITVRTTISCLLIFVGVLLAFFPREQVSRWRWPLRPH